MTVHELLHSSSAWLAQNSNSKVVMRSHNKDKSSSSSILWGTHYLSTSQTRTSIWLLDLTVESNCLSHRLHPTLLCPVPMCNSYLVQFYFLLLWEITVTVFEILQDHHLKEKYQWGKKVIGLVQQQFIFLFQETSIQRNTSETPAYCLTVGVSVNQLISTGAIFSAKDLDLSVVQILTRIYLNQADSSTECTRIVM